MLRGIIFDQDGTLVDTETQHYLAWNRLLQPLGHHLPEEDYIRDHNGVPTIGTAAALIERFALDFTPDELCHQKEKQIQLADERPPLMPGAEAILRHLHQHQVPMAVATGARYHAVERNLRHHQIYDLFHNVCSSSDVQHNKPAPDVYLLAAERLGLAPEECLAVEDTPTGMRSALAAGMPCVVIPSAPCAQHDFSAATYVMNHLDSLQDWLGGKLVTQTSRVL